MLPIHPNARTTPAVRAEIARSSEPSGVLAQRYGISSETVRKWRQRGAADGLDRSARPHRWPGKASREERAIVCARRRSTNFALDELTFVVRHVLPNRDSVWRILRAEGLSRRPKPLSGRPAKGQGRLRDDDLGLVHIDIKHLPIDARRRSGPDGNRPRPARPVGLQTAHGERRQR
jgi:transposase